METNNHKTLILSSSDVQKIVLGYGLNKLMDELIISLETAILNFDKSETDIPVRSGFNYVKPAPGLIEWMPIHQKQNEIVIKVVGYHPSNPLEHNLPTILSTISSYDINNGHLMGIVDGVLLTALRTGAASAVASKYLAPSNSSVLGLIGCGAQAVTQMHALSRVFDLKKVLIFDSDIDAMTSFDERCSSFAQDIEIENVAIERIVLESDILCTATSIEVGQGPLFKDIEVNPKLHINAVGSDFPGKIELPLNLLKKGFICPDFRHQAKMEGECQQLPDEKIGPEIIEVVQNGKAYEFTKNQLSVFDSTGWALEDQVVMKQFVALAKRMGIGQEFEIENILKDSKNPYDFVTSNVPWAIQ